MISSQWDSLNEREVMRYDYENPMLVGLWHDEKNTHAFGLLPGPIKMVILVATMASLRTLTLS